MGFPAWTRSIANIIAQITAAGVYVLKGGDTMTGSLSVGSNTVTAGRVISTGGGGITTPAITLSSGVVGGPVIRFGAVAMQSYLQLASARALLTDSTLAVRPDTTANRPTAASVGVGSQMYDTTLSKPIWSDGTNWRDAAGTIV